MQLVITGPSGARTCSWESYASLRAQLLRKVEADLNSGRFRALDTIAKAEDGRAHKVDAVRLRLEALQARAALCDKRVGAAWGDWRQAAPAEFLEIVLALTARAVAGDRLVIRGEQGRERAHGRNRH
jgi:hypothetical protein